MYSPGPSLSLSLFSLRISTIGRCLLTSLLNVIPENEREEGAWVLPRWRSDSYSSVRATRSRQGTFLSSLQLLPISRGIWRVIIKTDKKGEGRGERERRRAEKKEKGLFDGFLLTRNNVVGYCTLSKALPLCIYNTVGEIWNYDLFFLILSTYK